MMIKTTSLPYTAAIEGIATGALLIGVIGSGIMAERLCGGNIGLALLANAIATGCALFVLILTCGAQMNPVVTLAAAIIGELSWREVPVRMVAQFAGGILGVWLTHVRSGSRQWVAESVATFGLLAVVGGCRKHGEPVTAIAVAAYITGAYWFTASTAFANPAVTVARAFSDSFAGIRPADVPAFVAAQLAGLALALPILGRQKRAEA
jgi:glycerol uptake facilitator-like aquaporin